MSSITIEDVTEEIKELMNRGHYGFITIKMKAGEIMPIIDIKKSKKLKPKNGGSYEG